MSVRVRYDYGYNTSHTQQHEVIEYVMSDRPASLPTCRCIHPQHHSSGLGAQTEEGPYVVLYTERRATAEAIAMLLNADGTDNNFPETPLSAAKRYMQQRFAQDAANSPVPRRMEAASQYRTQQEEFGDDTDYSMAPGDCPPGDLGNEVR
jgi:hypothetical protein